MCHKTIPNPTHNGSMHQQTTTQGTTQHTKGPRPYPWQGHALNGKSGYPGSKKWLPRLQKLVTYKQHEHVPQNHTQSHPQW